MKKAISLILTLALVLALPMAALAEEDSFGAGTSDGNTYWNETLSIGCTMDENWYFYSDEEIMENVQATAGQLKDDLAEAIKDAGSMMDMMAVNQETGENVNVNLERLSVVNSLLVDEAKYVELSLAQLGDALEQMGITVSDIGQDEMEFAGSKHPCIRLTGTIEGFELFETLVVVKTGRTIIVVTACSYLEDTTDEILSHFYTEKP